MVGVPPANRARPDRRLAAVALVLAAGVAAVYGQTARHGFLIFDDDLYILANPHVAGGLSWRGFLWAFGYHAGNWHPLTWLSHMLDAEAFGLWAGGHHLTSAALHAVNAALLLAVLSAMTGALWRPAAVAALFALHPLRVESVAWAAERKDVLAALFWLLATGAYLRYARSPGARRYLAALGLFALGLAAKPMLVTLPLVLLLLDWWPLGRVSPRAWRRLLLEKAPFLALSLLSGLVTLRGQTLDLSSLQMDAPDLAARLANAAVATVAYLRSLAWPAGLAPLYPYPRAGLPTPVVAAATAALLAIVAAAALQARRRPWLATGWLWYLVALLPVVGLVQVGGQSRADRYTYLPLVGVAVALAWLAGEAWPRGARARRIAAAGALLALAALAATSAAYARVWRDGLSLFGHAVRVTEGNYLMLNNLAIVLMEQGRLEEAAGVLREEARANPRRCDAHYNLGQILESLGRHAEALPPLERALSCYARGARNPHYVADARYNLARALAGLGRQAEAAEHLRALLRDMPAYPGGRAALEYVRGLPGGEGARPEVRSP